MVPLLERLSPWAGRILACRACLGPVGSGTAGLCPACWEGLQPLPEPRCPRCAVPHGEECPAPTAWELGHALWDYHAGHPPLGALLVPGIKAGEQGWKRALLDRVETEPLPEAILRDLDLITSAPTPGFRRILRGFDLAEEAARLIARRSALPFQRTLRKGALSGQQARRTESERRRLPGKAIRIRPGARVEGLRILLVDDVWTTGTTLSRAARALLGAGAAEVRVLALFRALRG